MRNDESTEHVALPRNCGTTDLQIYGSNTKILMENNKASYSAKKKSYPKEEKTLKKE